MFSNTVVLILLRLLLVGCMLDFNLENASVWFFTGKCNLQKLEIDSFYSSCRYNDFNNAVKDFGSLFFAEDCLPDLFPLQVRIFVSWETNSLVAKISQKVQLMICFFSSSEWCLPNVKNFACNKFALFFFILFKVALYNL